MSRGDQHARGCRALIEWLDERGERKRANDVRGLLRSLDGSRNANAQLHRDNVALRRQIETMERDA